MQFGDFVPYGLQWFVVHIDVVRRGWFIIVYVFCVGLCEPQRILLVVELHVVGCGCERICCSSVVVHGGKLGPVFIDNVAFEFVVYSTFEFVLRR